MNPHRRAYWLGLAVGILLVPCITVSAPGDVDTSFDPRPNRWVEAFARQADGKVLICGGFTNIQGFSRSYIARLNFNGSLDTSFEQRNIDASDLVPQDIRCIAAQSNGNVLIAGQFWLNDGTPVRTIARFNTNGSFNATFNPTIQGFVESIVLQPDGKILIGGSFNTVNGASRSCIARLNVSGTLDASFNPGLGAGPRYEYQPSVYAVSVQSDGRVLIGGHFTTVNGTNRSGIARLNADGSLDGSFDPGTGATYDVYSVVLQSDGKVLIGGQFDSFNGINRNRIARLNTNGSLDSSFDPGTGVEGVYVPVLVHSIAIQPEGKVLIGGQFDCFNGTSRNRIAQLNANGSLDNSFDPGAGANATVRCVSVQADGKVLIGGPFTEVNGLTRSYMARLFGTELPHFTAITLLPDQNMQLAVTGPSNAVFQITATTNCVNWITLSNVTNSADTFFYTDRQATNFPRRFYRAIWLP